MRKTKTAVLDSIQLNVSVNVNVAVQESGAISFNLGEAGEELQTLFFRRAEYKLPAYVVQTPMPTLTCRHLEKATIHLLQGRPDQTLLAFKRAVASAIEPMTLIKVALACHTENHAEEAEAALKRAMKYAADDARSQALVKAIAKHFAYSLEG
jgi:tetratricopeptide (TPR) repeat protein